MDPTSICANPTIRADGRTWETEDSNPQWQELDSISGTLEINGDNSTLTAKDGTVFSYTFRAGFSDTNCLLLG